MAASKIIIKAVYIQGDGGICKLGLAAMKAVVGGAFYGDVGTTLSAEFNYRTGRWSKLPAALFAMDEGDSTLSSNSNGYTLVDSDDGNDEIVYACTVALATQ